MKNSSFLLVFIILIFSCEKKIENQKKHFFLHGKIDKSENQKVILKSQKYNKLEKIDSTIVKNGQFSFTGHLKTPEIYGIYFDKMEGVIGIFMENDTISVEINPIEIGKSVVIGSKSNDAYLAYKDESNRIISKMNILFPLFQKARSENNIVKLKEINSKMKAIQKENLNFTYDYIRKNSDSYVSAYALHSIIDIEKTDRDTILNLYNSLSNHVKLGDFSIQIWEFLNRE